MTPVGLLSPSRGELWEFVAIDRNGERRKYQSHSPAVATESQMLAHLRGAYPYCEIVGLRRITSGDYIPPGNAAEIKTHLFEHGTKQKFYDDFGKLSVDEKKKTLAYVESLPPVQMGNGDTMPDPYKVAVITACMISQRRAIEPEPPKRKSILEDFQPIRMRIKR